MAIEHENILKVVDIHHSQLGEDFIGFIQSQLPVYKDLILEEHLYGIENILEEEQANKPYPKIILAQLAEINTLLRGLDCSYFRVVYP
jgi:hypothetical protein